MYFGDIIYSGAIYSIQKPIAMAMKSRTGPVPEMV